VVKVDQPGAEVYVDGKRHTITGAGDAKPTEIRVREGVRHLKVVKEEFEPYTEDVTVALGERKTLQVRLKRKDWGERRAAEWVLQIGGSLSVKLDKGGEPLELGGAATALPERSFFVDAITLIGNQRVSDGGLQNLVGLRSIQALRLGASSLSDTGMASVCSLTTLTELGIGGTKVTDPGLEHLDNLKNLKILNLANCQVGGAGLFQVGRLTELDKLHLGGVQVGDTGLATLAGLNKLTFLSLVDNFRATDAAMDRLKSLGNLQLIWLKGTKISDGAVRRNFPQCTIDRT
jgi:hypothetical protein